jgi:CspA family cold shock protein
VGTLTEGIVDKYSEQKGLGYVLLDDGRSIFFERDSIDMSGYKSVSPGDHVTFDIEKTVRGVEAVHVRKVSSHEKQGVESPEKSD